MVALVLEEVGDGVELAFVDFLVEEDCVVPGAREVTDGLEFVFRG